MTPREILRHIAKAAKEKRLSLNFSQQSLVRCSGISLGVLKKFEGTGKISLEQLLKLAFVLDSLNDFVKVFEPTNPEEFKSLDELLKQQKKRKRGRK